MSRPRAGRDPVLLGTRSRVLRGTQERKFKMKAQETSLVVQWLGPRAPNEGCLGLIPGQGTKSHRLQLRPGAAKKINIKNESNRGVAT